MIGNRDFTVDPIHYNGTYKYFKELQNEGMKIILILVIFLNYIYNLRLNISDLKDPGLVIERNYTPFTTGLAKDVFIRWPENLDPIDDSLETNHVIS